MIIHNDISPMLDNKKKNILFAHSDAYPKYKWKLSCQFDKTVSNYFIKLNNKYNLNINYFQTGIMLFDTKLIEKDTFNNLYNLALEYPISKTNEQGIMNIYFNCEHKLWKQIPLKNSETYFYKYESKIEKNKIIITKIKK